jgi:hypothetical protein
MLTSGLQKVLRKLQAAGSTAALLKSLRNQVCVATGTSRSG